MATPQHAQYQGQVPQQRQAPNGQQQQQAFAQSQQKPVQSQQQPVNSYANYNPQLASFILEKPRGSSSWEDAQPEQQHVALQELHSELHKFRRNHGNVKKNMSEIPSPNCRRIINELVEDQNVELAKYNRTIQYRIASVVNKWRSVNRRERQLVRVDIILETEPSGFQDPMQTRIMAGGAGNGPQDPNKIKQPGNLQGQQFVNTSNPGQNMQQQQRPPQQHQQQYPAQHNMGPGQHFEPPHPQQHPGQANMNPMQGLGNPPPPPPPQGMHGPHDMPGPRPPMPDGGRPTPGPMHPPHPHHPPPGQPPMSGAFPDQIHMRPPPPHGISGQGRPVEILNPDRLRHQKSRHKVRHDDSGSSSDSDSSWEDESENSSFVNIEHDDHGRGRQRHNKKSKKNQKHRSLSKPRSLSRSLSRNCARRSNIDQYAAKSTRRRRTSDMIDDQRNGRLSPESFTTDSSRSSHNKIPGPMPPVHIHLNTNNVVEDRTRSGNASPADLYNEKRKSARHYAAHDMTRENSYSSSERGSGTESMNTASAHTADDGIFDRPIRRQPSFKHIHVHTRRKSSFGVKPQAMFDQPHPSHIYDDEVDHRRARKVRYPREPADDYPHPRSPREYAREPDSYFDDHPVHAARPNMQHRRATMANTPTTHNPFAQSHFPPKPIRASSYLADRHEQGYSYPQLRALPDREADGRYELSDIHAALEHIQEKKDIRNSTRRPNGMGRRDSAFQYEDDDWNVRVPLGPRRGTYDRY